MPLFNSTHSLGVSDQSSGWFGARLFEGSNELIPLTNFEKCACYVAQLMAHTMIKLMQGLAHCDRFLGSLHTLQRALNLTTPGLRWLRQKDYRSPVHVSKSMFRSFPPHSCLPFRDKGANNQVHKLQVRLLTLVVGNVPKDTLFSPFLLV